jgi:peptidylprolyl isomerase
MPVAKGDQVSVHYTVKLDDGTVVDSSQGGEPLKFEAGGQEVIVGVSQGVLGMELGDKQTITVPPEEAYGPHHADAVQKVELQMLPAGVKEGDQLQASSNGQEFVVRVVELGDDHAVLDANHPLAGQTLVFDLELMSVS